jgi:hypothetical protein
MMTDFEQYTRKTRRAIFLEEMERVVLWRELCALVEPQYPKAGKGRPPGLCCSDTIALASPRSHKSAHSIRASGPALRTQ